MSIDRIVRDRVMVILLKNAYRGSVFEVSTTVHPVCSPSTQVLPAGTASTPCVKDQVGFGDAVVLKSLLKPNGGSSSDDIVKDGVDEGSGEWYWSGLNSQHCQARH